MWSPLNLTSSLADSSHTYIFSFTSSITSYPLLSFYLSFSPSICLSFFHPHLSNFLLISPLSLHLFSCHLSNSLSVSSTLTPLFPSVSLYLSPLSFSHSRRCLVYSPIRLTANLSLFVFYLSSTAFTEMAAKKPDVWIHCGNMKSGVYGLLLLNSLGFRPKATLQTVAPNSLALFMSYVGNLGHYVLAVGQWHPEMTFRDSFFGVRDSFEFWYYRWCDLIWFDMMIADNVK